MVVHLRYASEEELQAIVGVGPQKAAMLVSARNNWNKLTYTMIENVTGRSMTPDEREEFVEWSGVRSEDRDRESEEEDIVNPATSNNNATRVMGPATHGTQAPANTGLPGDRPRGLIFDGSQPWAVFRKRYESFKDVLGWNDQQAYNYLEWSLEGPPAEYFLMLANAGSTQSWGCMLEKLEKRYGVLEGEEVMLGKLQTASQRPTESLENWMGRVQTMAMAAFSGCPDKYITRESIRIFCENCHDQAAGNYAALSSPKSLEDAMEKIKKFQYVNQRSGKQVGVQQIEVGSHLLPTIEKLINKLDTITGSKAMELEINRAGVDIAAPSQGASRGREPGWEMVMGKLDEMSREIATMKAERETTNWGGRQQYPGDFICWYCNQPGHFQRNCRARGYSYGASRGARGRGRGFYGNRGNFNSYGNFNYRDFYQSDSSHRDNSAGEGNVLRTNQTPSQQPFDQNQQALN